MDMLAGVVGANGCRLAPEVAGLKPQRRLSFRAALGNPQGDQQSRQQEARCHLKYRPSGFSI
jgi:hypothetical protein